MWRPTDREAGFALVDALVALVIIALSVTFCLAALRQAGRSADAALELRRANTLIATALATGAHGFEATSGQTDGFAWRLRTERTGEDRPVEICRRQAILESLGSDRTYETSTLVTCPVEAAA